VQLSTLTLYRGRAAAQNGAAQPPEVMIDVGRAV
jgi:hypothetical protein